MNAELLKLEGVNKRFGGVVAAENVSFCVEPGMIHGLIGPNGAGKSTCLNLISGIYPVDSGEIYLEGKNITRTPPYARARMGIGRTFQTPRFLQRSNIRDNLLISTDLADHSNYFTSFFRRQSDRYESELPRYMKHLHFSFDPYSDISSLTYGQLKMLEIVRTLLAHPKVMLVDEPAAGLNNKECEDVMALLTMAAKELGIGIALIEHSMDMIMNICEQIVVLNFGRVIGKGTPDEISRNKQVIAAYLGEEQND